MDQQARMIGSLLVIVIVINQELNQGASQTLYPRVLVSRSGGDASFECYHSFVSRIPEWLINGTSLNTLQLDHVESSESGFMLTFSNVPLHYNCTWIQCYLNTPSGIQSSATSTLLVQGVLSGVGSLNINVTENFTALITWTAPFTLDIDTIARDIAYYCVDVLNSTSFDLLHSECRITATEFFYQVSSVGLCEGYSFTVTPVNVVGNGTSKRIVHSQATSAPKVLESTLSSTGNITLIMSAPVCGGHLTILNIDTGENFTLNDSDLTSLENGITFLHPQIRMRHLYDVTVTAFNGAGLAASQLSLSTHDARNVTLNTDGIIKINYFEHSNASGTFIILIPDGINATEDLSATFYLAIDRNTSLGYPIPFGLPEGRVVVLVYDILGFGTLSNGMNFPAVKTEIAITNTTQGVLFRPLFTLLKSCQIITAQRDIIVECSYSSTVGFQIIVQSCVPNMTHILLVDQAIGQSRASVSVEKNGLYQVAVLAIRRETGILNATVEHIVKVMVDGKSNGAPTTILTAAATDTRSTTSNTLVITIGVVCLGVLALLNVLVVTVMARYWKARKIRSMSPPDHLEQPAGDAMELDPDATQLYEEIMDPISSPTEHLADGGHESLEAVSRAEATPVPEYDDVVSPNANYDLTQCPAYDTYETIF